MEDAATVTADWAKHYRLPGPGNMMERHENREQVFVNQGTRITHALVACMSKYGNGRGVHDFKMLDLGCGVGRVALPMFYFFQKPDICLDVDEGVVRYLKEVVPHANPEVSQIEPPTRFPNDEFDLIYAVSVWTHLPADLAHRWLLEVRRILRPGGMALITTSNYAVLEIRRRDPVLARLGWGDISGDDLRTQGFIFRETPSPPGTGHYGMASHDPEWIRTEWSKYFDVAGIESGAILGMQDINVLRRR